MYIDPELVQHALGFIAVAFAFIAAGLWAKASTIVIRDGDPRSKGGFLDGDVDVHSTVTEQGRWNKWAAAASGVATLFQALTLLFSSN